MREATFRDGAWLDVLVYGILAEEWQAKGDQPSPAPRLGHPHTSYLTFYDTCFVNKFLMLTHDFWVIMLCSSDKKTSPLSQHT